MVLYPFIKPFTKIVCAFASAFDYHIALSFLSYYCLLYDTKCRGRELASKTTLVMVEETLSRMRTVDKVMCRNTGIP
jgi:hypothetical protein